MNPFDPWCCGTGTNRRLGFGATDVEGEVDGVQSPICAVNRCSPKPEPAERGWVQRDGNRSGFGSG